MGRDRAQRREHREESTEKRAQRRKHSEESTAKRAQGSLEGRCGRRDVEAWRYGGMEVCMREAWRRAAAAGTCGYGGMEVWTLEAR
jgi:hypothetical protein